MLNNYHILTRNTYLDLIFSYKTHIRYEKGTTYSSNIHIFQFLSEYFLRKRSSAVNLLGTPKMLGKTAHIKPFLL